MERICSPNEFPEGSFLYYFQKLTTIPRGSGNTEGVQKYLEDLAGALGLFCHRDEVGNILIRKPATKGYESEESVIIQGHIDMVAVKDPDVTKDLEKEPLDLMIDGDTLYAKGTSLGADNGIAVAYMLAILTSDTLKHPELEFVFTNDEEIGLIGACNFDTSLLKGKRLINMDSEDEGVLMAGCAGGLRFEAHFEGEWADKRGTALEISISGLSGGHSGMAIHKGRANANVLMARVLNAIMDDDMDLISFDGGSADNVIPSHAKASVLVPDDRVDLTIQKLKDLEKEIANEYIVSDSGLSISHTELGQSSYRVASKELKDKIINYIRIIPDGVVNMSGHIPTLVETSANLGRVNTKDGEFMAAHCLRSSSRTRKKELIKRFTDFAGYMGAKVVCKGDYPPWEFKKDSPFRDRMIRIYEEMTGEPLKVEMIHAGLECGFFFDNIEGLDCVSFGPTLRDVHTTRESFDISSATRVWDFLVKVLE